MSFLQSFEMGMGRLCAAARKVFNPDAAIAPEAELQEVMSFPTGGSRKPLEVHFNLIKLDDWDGTPWRIIVESKNARHPYDEKFQLNAFFKEIMNPALFSALDRLEDVINKASDQALQESGLERGLRWYQSGRNEKPKIKPHMDGIELWADFKDVKNATQFYKKLVAAVQTACPEIQKCINQGLQPALNPTQEDLLIFDAQISAIMLRKMSEVSTLPINTVFVQSDGSRRPLIKGMDIDD